MKIAYEEHGEGCPIVLIHAFPLSRSMWAGQAEYLAKNGFRVILPDLFGFGETQAEDEFKSLEELARAVNDLLDHLKIEKAIIGGLSMGGYVTFNFYRMFPEKCSAIVLADTSSAADTEEKRAGRMKMIDNINENGVEVLIRELLPNLISEDTKKENSALVERLEREFSGVSKNGAVKALQAMADRKSHDFLLKDFSVPTVLIFGVDDRVTNIENAQRMANEIPNALLYLVEKAGHYSNLEQPQEFNRVLIEFLNSVKNNAEK